ncbi:phosphate ABC transporter permease subunit PstC [Flavobacteriaceae bacterium AU392]|nr:phosphate ABC transporter permease subunit PstC [Flavobacteriaceae bacterium]RKM84615.1 phosphate ABC transporter permease subunit PstC [Flavobacteriaceae bacterium AU392]
MLASTSKIGKGYILTSTTISAAVIIVTLVVLLSSSWDAISNINIHLFTVTWNPPANQFGILSMLYGTLAVTCIALCISIPLGILTAIFTSEFLSSKYRFAVKSLLELLAGIPSIIYGLIGIAFFSVWLQNAFDLQSGRTILAGGILLGIMILPTIITLSDDAIQNVPSNYKEAAYGLGLYKYEVIKNVLLPIAKPNLIGAILLSLGRAMGETMAVMLVIGSIDRIPNPIYNVLSPGQTITSKLGREIGESSFGSTHFSALIFMGVFLLSIVIVLTIIAQQKYKSKERLYE